MHIFINIRFLMSKLFLSRRQLYRMTVKCDNKFFEEDYPENNIPIINKKKEDVPNYDENDKFTEDEDKDKNEDEEKTLNESSNDSSDEELKKIELQKFNKQKNKNCLKKSCLSPVSVSDINYIKKNLKVQFVTTVSVILIPCRKEYIDIALDKLLWYSFLDYQYFLECEILRKIDKKIDLF